MGSPACPGWGVQVPFSDINVTRFNGTSDYNGFTAELRHTRRVQAVNTFFTQAGQPTAAYDPRQFQVGLKLGW
jgi:hypothetical protein